jgi:hypothetical protein
MTTRSSSSFRPTALSSGFLFLLRSGRSLRLVLWNYRRAPNITEIGAKDVDVFLDNRWAIVYYMALRDRLASAPAVGAGHARPLYAAPRRRPSLYAAPGPCHS